MCKKQVDYNNPRSCDIPSSPTTLIKNYSIWVLYPRFDMSSTTWRFPDGDPVDPIDEMVRLQGWGSK